MPVKNRSSASPSTGNKNPMADKTARKIDMEVIQRKCAQFFLKYEWVKNTYTATQLNENEYQNLVYKCGKESGFNNLKDWFKAIYEVLLGQPTGPRIGPFIAIYGKKDTTILIKKVLEEKTFR